MSDEKAAIMADIRDRSTKARTATLESPGLRDLLWGIHTGDYSHKQAQSVLEGVRHVLEDVLPDHDVEIRGAFDMMRHEVGQMQPKRRTPGEAF